VMFLSLLDNLLKEKFPGFTHCFSSWFCLFRRASPEFK
jgi:hypothetical protein